MGEGAVWVPYRVRAFYPLLKEVCEEIDEIERREADYERRRKAAAKGWKARRRRAGHG